MGISLGIKENFKMTKEMPYISIIVPIYNNEAHLVECVQSLIKQSYNNLQIILVDDGSIDLSSKICDEFKKNDSRIIVIHKKNGGPNSARQAGIEVATGKYVMFVDGDDWIESDACEESVRVAIENQADCVMFGYIREYEKKSILNPLFENDFSYNKELSERNIHRRLIGMTDNELVHPEKIDNIVSVCMKLYRLEIVQKGKFVDEKIVGTSEDTIFNIYALENCSVSYINKCFYHYRKTNTQSITSKHKENLPERWDELYRLFDEYLINSGNKERYNSIFLNRVACGMIGLGLNEISGNANIIKKIKGIKKILSRPLYKKAFSQMSLEFCPLHWKVFFLLCKWRAATVLTLLLIIINYLRYNSSVN